MSFWDGVAESFGDLGDAIRKIVPESLGGGYTEKEKEEIKKNLEQAEKNVQENEARNGYYNPFEAVTGAENAGYGMLIVAMIVLVWIALKD